MLVSYQSNVLLKKKLQLKQKTLTFQSVFRPQGIFWWILCLHVGENASWYYEGEGGPCLPEGEGLRLPPRWGECRLISWAPACEQKSIGLYKQQMWSINPKIKKIKILGWYKEQAVIKYKLGTNGLMSVIFKKRTDNLLKEIDFIRIWQLFRI